MEKIIGTVPGKCRKKREKARLTLNNNPEISWHMKKSRRTYNGVHLNKKSNTQDVVEQSLTVLGNRRSLQGERLRNDLASFFLHRVSQRQRVYDSTYIASRDSVDVIKYSTKNVLLL